MIFFRRELRGPVVIGFGLLRCGRGLVLIGFCRHQVGFGIVQIGGSLQQRPLEERRIDQRDDVAFVYAGIEIHIQFRDATPKLAIPLAPGSPR